MQHDAEYAALHPLVATQARNQRICDRRNDRRGTPIPASRNTLAGDGFDAKPRLVRLLYERDWTRQRILDFFSVLDWMMRLPKELEQRLWQDIENIEGERKVFAEN